MAPDEKLRQQGLDELGFILPIFMINNLKGDELLVYLKAKLEGAKAVQKQLEKEKKLKAKFAAEKQEQEDNEELVELAKPKEEEKHMEMEMDLDEDQKMEERRKEIDESTGGPVVEQSNDEQFTPESLTNVSDSTQEQKMSIMNEAPIEKNNITNTQTNQDDPLEKIKNKLKENV
jgi:hypothetical protein